MKNNQAITIASVQHSPVLESIIEKNDAELKALAEKNAKHHAQRNRPDPVNDSLPPFVGDIKTGYERVAAEILHFLMPKSHLPQGKIDIDFHKEKSEKLDVEIKTREDKIRHDEYEQSNYNPGIIKPRLWIMGIFSFIIFLGEVVFNTKALQVTGENMLRALILSIAISLGVFLFSHFVSFSYKEAQSAAKKRLIVIGTLLLVTGVFLALAMLRTTYLASHDVHISPIYFVIINLFLFIVSALLSYYLLPTWQELKEHFRHLQLHSKISKRKQEIINLKEEQDKLKDTINESTKVRLQLMYYSNYAAERLRKLYFEKVEIFKSRNLVYRTDGKTPECFKEAVPEPDIEFLMLQFKPSNNSEQ